MTKRAWPRELAFTLFGWRFSVQCEAWAVSASIWHTERAA